MHKINKETIKFIFTIIIISTLVGGAYFLLNKLSEEDVSIKESEAAEIPAECKKLGINYANMDISNDYANSNIRASSYNMGYVLLILQFDNQQWQLAEDFNDAINRGMTPILRACYGSTCPYADPQKYVDTIKSLSDLIGNRTFYVITGPNEPLGENWLGGKIGDYAAIAPLVANYMNSVITKINLLKQSDSKYNTIKLLSPVFNLTEPNFENFVDALNDSGAYFQGLDGIAGNAYNLRGYHIGETVTAFVTRLRNAGFSNYDIYLTEIGMFESAENPNWTGIKVPRAEALVRLKQQVDLLKLDSKVKAYLLFDSFATNPDTNYEYNFINDTEMKELIGTECNIQITVVPTLSPTPTITIDPSPSVSPSPTPTITIYPSPSPSPTFTQTPTPTPTVTPTITPTISITPTTTPAVCTSFTYSEWSSCINGTRTRTVLEKFPAGCQGGNPVLSESCVIECGPIDVNSDTFLTLIDLAAFVKMYAKTCQDSTTIDGCGSRDTNHDGTINLIDLANLAKRYSPNTCIL